MLRPCGSDPVLPYCFQLLAAVLFVSLFVLAVEEKKSMREPCRPPHRPLRGDSRSLCAHSSDECASAAKAPCSGYGGTQRDGGSLLIPGRRTALRNPKLSASSKMNVRGETGYRRGPLRVGWCPPGEGERWRGRARPAGAEETRPGLC